MISETGPRFFCKESEMSATTYAIDSNTATRLSSESSKEKSSKFYREEMYAAIEPKAARKLSSESFKSREYEGSKLSFDEVFKKSDSKTARKLSPESSKGRVKRGQSPKFKEKSSCSIDSKTARKLSLRSSIRDEARRDEDSTRFKEGGTIESDESEKFSNVGESRGDVAKFFCQENEKSATTYAADSKSPASDSPDYMRNTESFLLKIERRNRKDNITMDNTVEKCADGQVKRGEGIRKSSSSPEDSRSIKTKSFERLTRERGSSPRFFNREREKSIGFEEQEHAACKSPNLIEKDMKKRGYENVGGKSPDFTRRRSNTSPQFFSSDRSATIVMVTPETIRKPRGGVTGSKRKEQNAKKIESKRKPSLDRNETKHSVSRFFSEKSLRNGEQEIEGKKRDSSPSSSKHARTPSPLAKPQFYHREKATKTVRTRCGIDGSTRRHSSPRRVVANSKEFFCYEARSFKRGTDVRSKGGKSIERRETGTKSRPPADDDDDLTVSRLDRGGFEHTLRSTKLIRDTMTSDANRVDHSSSIESKRAGMEEIATVESSPKSCTPVEVDTEIQEITMPDQYVKREQCRDASDETKLADSERSRIEKLFTYSVRKPVKQRRSLPESNVFERSEARRRGERSSHKDLATSSKLSSKKRSVYDASKREEAKEKDISREQTASPSQVRRGNKTEKYNARESIAKRKTVERAMNREDEGEGSPQARGQEEILKSMELVRRAMRGSSFETASDDGLVEEGQIGITARGSAVESGTGKNYERTDSVESALRRFDSIGTETGSIRSDLLERSEESIRQTLDRSSSPEESSPRKISKLPSGCRGDLVAGGKYLSKARMEEESNIGRMPRSCKRKLFHDFSDSGEETETGSARSRCSLDSVRTVEYLWTRYSNDKKKTREHSMKTRLEFGDGTSRGGDKGEAGETSTGADRSLLSVKRLRSIEDIRRSIEGESKSVIESGRGTGRSEARRINIDDRGASGGRMFLPRRSGNVAAGNKGMGDTSRSAVKCAMRFPRVVKSPSPETVKTAETGNRARRNVPPSPSKSPDTMPRVSKDCVKDSSSCENRWGGNESRGIRLKV